MQFYTGMPPLRETVIVTLGQNNQTIHASQCVGILDESNSVLKEAFIGAIRVINTFTRCFY